MDDFETNLYGDRDVSSLVNRIKQLQRIQSGNFSKDDDKLLQDWLAKRSVKNNDEVKKVAGSEAQRLIEEYKGLQNQAEGQRQKDQLGQLRGQLTSQANDFDKNALEIENRLQGSAGDTARQELAQSLLGARAQANRRGMLYSGGLAANEADMIGNARAGMLQNKAAIATEVRDTQNKLRDASLNAGLNNQQLALNTAKQAQDLQDRAYNQRAQSFQNQLNAQNQMNQMYAQAGSAIGNVAGTLYGRQKAIDAANTPTKTKKDQTVIGGGVP